MKITEKKHRNKAGDRKCCLQFEENTPEIKKCDCDRIISTGYKIQS